MASSRAHGSPVAATSGRQSNPGRRGRRALAAFLLGAALSAAGIGAIVAGDAAAHGPFVASNPMFSQAPSASYAPTYSVVHVDAHAARAGDDEPRRKRISLIAGHTGKASHVSAQGAVCVRLCDGYFFPLDGAAGVAGGPTAACDSQCPDAPTEVYYRGGSDRIEDAVSGKGQLYSALPVSLRYRKSSDNTCSCHRDVVAYAPLRDLTLHQGDAVMTPAGFMVFKGYEGASHTAHDFSALAQVRMSSQQRGALQAMERVSLENAHPNLQTWLVSQNTPERRFFAAVAAKITTPSLTHASLAEDKIRLLRWRAAED